MTVKYAVSLDFMGIAEVEVVKETPKTFTAGRVKQLYGYVYNVYTGKATRKSKAIFWVDTLQEAVELLHKRALVSVEWAEKTLVEQRKRASDLEQALELLKAKRLLEQADREA